MSPEVAGIVGPVLVAVVMGGPAWVNTRRMRRENESQHADNLNVLTEVRDGLVRVETTVGDLDRTVTHLGEKVDQVDAKVERHLGEHAGAEKAALIRPIRGGIL